MDSRNLTLAVIVAATLCGCSTSDNYDQRPYISGAGVASKLSPRTVYTNQSTQQISTYSHGAQVGGGYALSKNIHAVAQLSDLGRARLPNGDDLAYKSADVGLSFRQHFASNITSYAKVMAGKMHLSADQTDINQQYDVHQSLAVGAEVKAGEKWALNAEIGRFDKDAQAVSIGMARKFGSDSARTPATEALENQVVKPVPEAADQSLLASEYLSFEPHSSRFTAAMVQELERMLKAQENQGSVIYLRGFTDLGTDADPARTLANERAEMVQQALKRIVPDRKTQITEGMGLKNPHGDPQRSAFNRRVELLWY